MFDLPDFFNYPFHFVSFYFYRSNLTIFADKRMSFAVTFERKLGSVFTADSEDSF